MNASTVQFPRYVQVEKQLREAIESGVYRAGDRLPDERELANQLSVSRGTIRQALSRLTQQGLVERCQGRGTFVARAAITSGYICMVAVGITARTTLQNAVSIGETERLATAHGLHVTVRYCDDEIALEQVMGECEREETITAGIIIGTVPECPLDEWVADSHKPWVLMADFVSDQRRLPPINQVIFDWYQAFETGTRHLLQQGCSRPAMFVLTDTAVWSLDRISAFRTVCDEIGIEPCHQRVYDLHRYHHEPVPVPEYQARVQKALVDTAQSWLESGNIPDGLILPVSRQEGWVTALRDTPELAKAMKGVPVIFWTIEEELSPAKLQGPVTYLHLSVAELAQQAMQRLLENHNDDMPPRRDYVRAHRLVNFD